MTPPRSHVHRQVTWIAMMDLACLVVGGFAGVMLRLGPGEVAEYVFAHLEGWLLFFGSIILANYLAGSYRLQYTFSRFNLVVTWLFSLAFATILLSIMSYAWFMLVLGRGVLVYSIVSYSVMSLFLKLLVYRALFRTDAFLCRTCVLGVGTRAKKIREMVENEFVLPAHKVMAFIRLVGEDPGEGEHYTVEDGVVVVDRQPHALESLIRSLGIDLIILALENPEDARSFYPQLRRLRFEGVEVLSEGAAAEIYSGRVPLDTINNESLMDASMQSGFPMSWRLKRITDLCLALVGIVVFAPVAILVALLLKLSDIRSPVLYSQLRVGQFGRQFRIYKFRTMRPDAERESGPVWAAASDPRITRLGRVLRRFRLDEIPQLVNVLDGDMSIVGPRPERPELSDQLAQEIPFFAERENVVPGLTGWAQIRYPYGSTIEDAKRKLEYDLYYIKHLSFPLDLQIILSTLRIMVMGKERSV